MPPKFYDKLHLLILLLGITYISSAQSLCDGRAFFTAPSGSNTALYRFNTNNLSFEPVVADLPNINGIGFNPTDNTIYGIAQGNVLYKLAPDGQTAISLGAVQGLTPGGLWAGCFSPSGLYFFTGNVNQIYHIDVTSPVPTVVGEATKFYINNSGAGTPSFGDIVIDPTTGILYGYDDNTKKLASIDPFTGAVDAFGIFNDTIPVSGGMIADAQGEIYAFVFDGFYQVDKLTGAFTFLYDAPTNNGGIDACNCPYYVDLFKNSQINQPCPGDTISYDFVITNSSQNILTDITFIDSLASSLIIISEPDDLFGGSIQPNSGMGFNHIMINNMVIPEGVSSFQLQVKVPLDFGQQSNLYNQAKMIGFPDHLPPVLWSDDESTPAIDDPTEIVVSSLLSLELDVPELNCVGDSLTIYAQSQEGDLFQWSNEEGILSEENFLLIPDVTLEQAGTYDLQYTSVSGCAFDTSINVNIYPNALVNLGEDTSLCLTEPYRLSAGFFSDYRWNDGSSDGFILVEDYGTYSVSVTNEYGCEGEDAILLSSGCPGELYIPNAFSPNGDGVNDVFLAYGLEVIEFSLRIFGRWGEELFYSNSITKGWDGSFLGKPLDSGVYVYSLKASFLNGDVIRESGDIFLLK